MPTRLGNIAMILLIGPLAYFVWRTPQLDQAGNGPYPGRT